MFVLQRALCRVILSDLLTAPKASNVQGEEHHVVGAQRDSQVVHLFQNLCAWKYWDAPLPWKPDSWLGRRKFWQILVGRSGPIEVSMSNLPGMYAYVCVYISIHLPSAWSRTPFTSWWSSTYNSLWEGYAKKSSAEILEKKDHTVSPWKFSYSSFFDCAFNLAELWCVTHQPAISRPWPWRFGDDWPVHSPKINNIYHILCQPPMTR